MSSMGSGLFFFERDSVFTEFRVLVWGLGFRAVFHCFGFFWV